MTMKKQLTLSYIHSDTDSKKQYIIRHFVSADGELFFEINRELTLEELENWEVPRDAMVFHMVMYRCTALKAMEEK